MQPLQQSSLQVNTDLNILTQVLAWFDQFNGPPLSDEIWLQCQLILVEGFTNAVRHAHKNKPVDCLIELEVILFLERIEMRIWDQGEPFDLNQKLKELPQDLDCYAEGGRGLRLIQKITDFLSYTRTADVGNCLLMIKHYSPSEIVSQDTGDSTQKKLPVT